MWLLLSYCGQQAGKAADVGPNISQIEYPPVDTLSPLATGQNPAFKGQSRAPGFKTQSSWKVSIINDGLRNPWGLAFLPDSRILVSEKPGSLRIIDRDGTLGDTIGGVPPVFYGQDGGLLDVALDPEFPINRMIYWAFSEPHGNEYLTVIAKGKLSLDERWLEGVKILYRATPSFIGNMHFGSRLLFDKEGYLLVSLGERAREGMREKAQDLMSALGKVIRITKDGEPAPGNPFEDRSDALPEIWSWGHRHPQGLAFHPQTGDLWLSDHGPRSGDEINIIFPGKNYGWPVISYGIEYDNTPVNGGSTAKSGMEQPVYYWDPAIAPSGITFYSGALIPEWKNNLFVASLRGKHIARLIINDGKVVGEERLLVEMNERIRHIVEGPDGALYVLTDEPKGRLLRISDDKNL